MPIQRHVIMTNVTRTVPVFSTRRTRNKQHRSKFHAAKHGLRKQNISSNFSEARFNTP